MASVRSWKENFGPESQEALRQGILIGGKPPSVK
jgi:hypothetical protein